MFTESLRTFQTEPELFLASERGDYWESVLGMKLIRDSETSGYQKRLMNTA